MKAIIFTVIMAFTSLIVFSILIFHNKQFAQAAYTNQLCRAKTMAKYEAAWDSCCALSNQSTSCKAQRSCEPKWDTYASQMSACFK